MKSFGLGMDLSLDLIDSVPALGAPGKFHVSSLALQEGDAVFDSVSYTYTNGWHVFTFDGYVVDISTLDTTDISGTDSVQILAAGSPLAEFDSTVDAMKIRAEMDISARGGNAVLAGVQRFDITDMTSDSTVPVTLNGTMSETADLSFADSAGSCDMNLDNSVSVDNVVIVLESDECPRSGSMSAVTTVNVSCAGQGDNGGTFSLNVNDTWHVTATFDNGTMTTVFNNSTTTWTVTDTCNSGQASSPAAWLR